MPNGPSPYMLANPSDESLEDPLRLRLDFHEETVVLYTYGEINSIRTVSALDVAAAFARELPNCTPILPPGTIWHKRVPSGEVYAIWRNPQVWHVSLVTKFNEEPRKFRLPMPGLIFITAPGRRWVFAARRYPRDEGEPLFKCPTFNIFRDGGICTGSHKFPDAPELLPDEFFRSRFASGHTGDGLSRKHPGDILALWEELDGRKEYPLDDLVPALTVGDARRLGE